MAKKQGSPRKTARKSAVKPVGKAAKTVKSKGRTVAKVVKAQAARKAVTKAVRKRRPVSAAAVQLLAMESETMAAAAVALPKLTTPLGDVLEAFADLQAAWDRGRFLRRLGILAATAVSVSEAARELGVSGPQLREQLDTDAEAAEIWNDARIAVLVEIKTAMVESAKDGKPAAIRQIERLLRSEIVTAAADFHHVTIAQLVELTGRTRQAVHDWHTQYGLPRNSDKSYDLVEFLRWFEEFTLRKRAPGKAAVPMDPLKAAKAEKLEIELERQRGHLLARDQVMAGQLARYQAMLNALHRGEEDLAIACHDQPPEKITAILRKFFDEMRSQLCQVPEELRLPPAAAESFQTLLTGLQPEGDDDNASESDPG